MRMISTPLCEEVRNYIEDHSRFGEATHDDVLQRLLGIEVKSRPPKKKCRISRATQEQMTTLRAYASPILKVLLAVEGLSLSIEEVKQGVEAQMDLTLTDRKRLKGGKIRWEDRLEHARLELVKEDLLYSVEQAGRGNWELTAKGVEAAKKLS